MFRKKKVKKKENCQTMPSTYNKLIAWIWKALVSSEEIICCTLCNWETLVGQLIAKLISFRSSYLDYLEIARVDDSAFPEELVSPPPPPSLRPPKSSSYLPLHTLFTLSCLLKIKCKTRRMFDFLGLYEFFDRKSSKARLKLRTNVMRHGYIYFEKA